MEIIDNNDVVFNYDLYNNMAITPTISAIMKKIDGAMSISVGLENQRDFEVRKQVKEVEYWMRTVDDLLDDVYASQEQIKQRAVRLKMEYNKLKEICKNSRVYLSDYLVLDELKYEAILRTKEINKLKVL